MSLDSRLRLARRNGTGTNVRHWEVGELCEALQLLRACERAERSEAKAADLVSAAAAVEGAERVRIWSDEHRAYWRGGGCGYTTFRVAAGVYERAEAEGMTSHCDPSKRIRIETIGEDEA